MGLLDGELAEIIGDALDAADLTYSVTLTRTVPGIVDPAKLWIPPTDTTEQFTCMGFVDAYRRDLVDGTNIQADDFKVVIVATSLQTEPKPGDVIMARGQSFTVITATPDPAMATWEVQSRSLGGSQL